MKLRAVIRSPPAPVHFDVSLRSNVIDSPSQETDRSGARRGDEPRRVFCLSSAAAWRVTNSQSGELGILMLPPPKEGRRERRRAQA